MLMGIELFGVEKAVCTSLLPVLWPIWFGHNSIYSKQRIGESKSSQWIQHEGNSISELNK